MNLNTNFRLVHGTDLSVYYDNYGKGWRNLDEVKAGVPNNVRDKVTVLVGDQEYWWDTGIADADLIAKIPTVVPATTTTSGIVKQSATQAANTTADAPVISAAYTQAEVQAIATLANALKTDLNGLIAKLRASGLMA